MKENVKFTEAQMSAINEIEQNLQIIACAGSGKTEVITRRISNILKSKKDVLPEGIVAFTFTEKAAEVMKNRVKKALLDENVECDIENMYIGTIHAFCFDILKKYTDKYENIKILDGAKNYLFVKRYEKECGINTLQLQAYPRDIHLFFECKEKMIDDYDNRLEWDEKSRQALEEYIECLYKHNFIDFSLLIFETIRQIEENPNVKEYLSTIKYLIVDEYQDVNDMQEKLIKHIVAAGANICVVGDDDQTIYQFRGSDSNNMVSFDERYSNVKQIRLEDNFRSAKQVIDVAKSVIENNSIRLQKNMISRNSIQGKVQAIRFDSEEDEYNGIINKIIETHQAGVPYHEIAVLVRKGKYIKHIASGLESKGVLCLYDSVENYFESEAFCRYIIVLKMMETLDKAELYDSWKNIISDEDFSKGFKYLRMCSRNGGDSRVARLSSIISKFCDIVNYADEEAINGIVRILDDYDEIYGDYQLTARVGRIIDFLSREAIEEYKHAKFISQKDIDAVQIMTIHQAKGLEFDTVFMIKLEDGEFPGHKHGGRKFWNILGEHFENNKEKYITNIDEERNLFYVAVTRAKRQVFMTYQLSKHSVSMFVKESAKSKYLSIDKDDLNFDPKKKKRSIKLEQSTYKARTFKRNCEDDSWVKRIEEICILQEEFRRQKEKARRARNELTDYYGTGAHFCPAMYSEISRVKKMDDNEVIREAIRHGLM